MRILDFTIDVATLKKLNARRLNQLIGCMHAHNELSALNRLLLFSMNETGEGELHDSAYSVQMWFVLQLLAGKLFETWEMLCKRILLQKPEDPIVAGLSQEHGASLAWLQGYFGDKNYKSSPIKLVRDTTAFHYGGLDLQQSLGELGDWENHVYLAQHPANSLYFLGSAAVFKSLFVLIADKAGGNASATHNERIAAGWRIVTEDVKNANWHVHLVLYGFIEALLQHALGPDFEAGDRADIEVLDAPLAEKIGLPSFIAIGGSERVTSKSGE